ncbi:hypothetical protein SAMN05428949_4968 [Chitinophaga sp. YR627]|uniref:hypothetical protein n=1 Tax=Chitinophaga sp. YR627 TaxID=1881041 RepID=UPI0008DFDB29|nr:hypothetical protein [Chitinophaga sp. YR627]SFO32900.1 hypothetical protein SAMN05428949_4968 [Chitinophaga sp. YR627]
MDSLFSNLFLTLEARIGSGVPLIKGVYPELSQTENYNGNPSVWPCVFLDFTNLTYSELTGSIQAASGELQCRLVFPVTSSNGSTFLDTSAALNYYEAELKLHQVLQGWTNSTIAPLTRISVSTEDRDDTFRVRVLTYSLNFHESPLPPVTSEIEKPPLELLS